MRVHKETLSEPAGVRPDSHAAGNSEPEVRRLLVEWFKEHSFSGVAGYGGSMISRTISTLAQVMGTG